MSNLTTSTYAEGQPQVTTYGVPLAPAALEAGEKSIVFGITFNLNGQLVPISTANINEAKVKGIDLALPGPTVIGSIDDFIAWFKTQFGIDLPAPDDFPTPLNQIFSKITSLVWTVNEARVHVPGSGPGQALTYALAVTAAWEGPGIELIPGILSIQGGMFGVTNEAAKTT